MQGWRQRLFYELIIINQAVARVCIRVIAVAVRKETPDGRHIEGVWLRETADLFVKWWQE